MSASEPGQRRQGTGTSGGDAVRRAAGGAVLLQVRGLGLSLPDMPNKPFFGAAPMKRILHDVSFTLDSGGTLGVIGESGSGKSTLARALTMLMPPQAGHLLFQGRNVGAFTADELVTYRSQMQLIFQDPMSSLNPVMTVGAQIDDMLCRHAGLSRRAARRRTVELLDLVGIRDPALRADDHPHQFSGGMRQRVLIAIAVSCQPALLIADEPTTALDVTVQAQILRLLLRLKRDLGMALMLITHDFGVIAGMVARVYVMRDGDIVETGDVDTVFAAPGHPYTRALLDAVPRLSDARRPA